MPPMSTLRSRITRLCSTASLLACAAALLMWFGFATTGQPGTVGRVWNDLHLHLGTHAVSLVRLTPVAPKVAALTNPGYRGPVWHRTPVAAAPYGVIAAAALLLPVGRVVNASAGRARTRRRVAVGKCAACGYDLRGSAGRCPECGVGAVRGST